MLKQNPDLRDYKTPAAREKQNRKYFRKASLTASAFNDIKTIQSNVFRLVTYSTF